MSKMLMENNAIACSLVQGKRGVATSRQHIHLCERKCEECEREKFHPLYAVPSIQIWNDLTSLSQKYDS